MQFLAAKGFKGGGGGGKGETNEFDSCMRKLKLSAPSSGLLVSLINSYLEFLHFEFFLSPLFRDRLSKKMRTPQSRKVIWDMINILFLTL